MQHSLKFAGLALIAICWAVPFSYSAEKGSAEKAPAPALVMQLTSPDTSVKVKERVQVKVTITNHGKRPVTLVQPGDGSQSGWRTPVVNWSVLQVGDKAKHPAEPVPQGGPRCGNMNPLQADELFDLAPGASKELTGWMYLAFARPGEYRVVFLYANRPALTWKGISQHDPASMKRVKRVRSSTPCSLVSNEVVFTIEEGKEQHEKE